MRDTPSLSTPLALRCFHRSTQAGPPDCGELAAWFRAGSVLFAPAFYCDRHRFPSDVPLGAAVRVLRIRLSCVVDLAGVAWQPGIARTEAVEHLRAACQAAGAQLHVLSATSAMVENPAWPLPGADIARGGVGEVGGVKD